MVSNVYRYPALGRVVEGAVLCFYGDAQSLSGIGADEVLSGHDMVADSSALLPG